MAERKRYLLRIDPRLYGVLERWAADELRSVSTDRTVTAGAPDSAPESFWTPSDMRLSAGFEA